MGAGDGAGGNKLFVDGVGEFFPELGVDWEIEPFVPLFLQNLRMFLTLTIEVLRDRVSLPGARLFGLWSSVVESNENLLDGVRSSTIVEETEDFLALWVGRVGTSGTAGTGGVSSKGINDEGYLPNGSGESGMIGDSRDRGCWRGGYNVSCLCLAIVSSEMGGGESFPPGDGFCGRVVAPLSARSDRFSRSASNWESRTSGVSFEKGTTGQTASSVRLALNYAVSQYAM